MIQAIHTLTAKGPQSEKLFVDYIAEENVFAVISIEYESSEHNGTRFSQELRDIFVSSGAQSLSDLESRLSDVIKKNNLPAHFSLVFGYKKMDGIYLKTYGSGLVFLCRGKDCVRIVDKNLSASGKIHEKDVLIFINNDIENIKQFVHKSSIEIAEMMSTLFQDPSHTGEIALICDFGKEINYIEKKIVDTTYASDILPGQNVGKTQKPLEKIFDLIQQLYKKSSLSTGGTTKGKKITFILVCVLFVIFVWSVVLGYQRRGEANIQKKINATKELITQKLNQVDEVAYLNMPRAMILINEARTEIGKLKKDVGNKKELEALETMVNQKENSIVKKEDKKYDEFFDLSVDNKQTKGDMITLDGDTVGILDKTQGAAYILSLTKKSLVKRTAPEIKGANNIVIYQNSIFIITNSGGIIKITEDGKVKKIIDQDKEWGMIAGISIYNGNIYLLDKGKDEVYKYLVAENGYSGKSSYFKSGQAIKLSESNSIAIDSSVYLGLNTGVIKFTAGIQDEFKTSYPDGVKLSKVFTTKDLEKVYAWSKEKGSIYILSKDGTYEREASVSISKQADDFIVYNNIAYILKGQKIYSVDLH